jgi:glutathione reductase (NADPH)
MSDLDVDLFVIGAGSAGVRAARIAAGHGARVMLAEEFRVGGTCVIRGCVPKKLLVYASRFSEAFADAAGFGWTVPPASFDWRTLVRAKEREITRLEGLYGRTQENAGVKVVRERAVLAAPGTVRLVGSGHEVKARHILVATGAAPVMPGIPGIEHAISSNEAFDLPEFPRRIVIVGGGYIAVEFAGLFAGLGAEVTIVHRGDNLLRGFDEDLRVRLKAAYEKRGIRLLLNETIASISRDGDLRRATTAGGASLEADQVMFAIGRAPNTQGLGLEKLGVALKADGAITVDAHSRTNVEGVYAVGDVTNRVALTPVAIREGHAFADSVFGGHPWTVDHADIPTAVFSSPEIGTVGLTEAQAKQAHASVDVYKAEFRPMKATVSGRESRTFMKLLADGESGRVLGVHILGDDAAEMVQLVGISIKMKATKADFDATMALHPSAAEELVTMRTPSERWRA